MPRLRCVDFGRGVCVTAAVMCRDSSRPSQSHEDEKRRDTVTTTTTATADSGDVGVPVRALFDYKAQEPDELSFTAGQHFNIQQLQLYVCFQQRLCIIRIIVAALYGIRQTIIFLPCGFLLSSSLFPLFPRLISAAADWTSTILLHMAWP